MKKVMAIVFSDLHIGLYNKFNQDNKRTLSLLRVLFDIREACFKYNVSAIFCGDLFHKPEIMENALYQELVKAFRTLDEDFGTQRFIIHCITGNHDFSTISTIENWKGSKSWVRAFAKQYKFIKCMDMKDCLVAANGNSFRLFGVPYIDHNIGLNDYIKNLKLDEKVPNILMLHTDFPGARDTDNTLVDSVENLNVNLLNRFDLTLCGHIHKPQRLSKKVYMVGAPCQQRRTDRDCELGYWKLYSDLSMEFVPLKDYPRFIDVESEDEIEDDGNYYTVVKRVETKETEVQNRITTDLTPKKLVRKYLKSRGEYSKEKKSLLLNLIKDSND